MAFTRADLENYEKQPQKAVDDKLNPFRGATPARAADAAAVAAVAAGQVDATPGGSAAAAASDPIVDEDAPIVDENGTLGDQTDSGEGTSDEDADSSTAVVELSDDTDPNADLTGDEEVEASRARPAPKKGSAEERIVELNDLLEGTKIFGKHMQDQLKGALAELERLKAGGKPTAAQTDAASAPPVVEDEPMPDLADADVAFDNDKYRAKMQKWTKNQAKIAARELIQETTGADEITKRKAAVEKKIADFVKTNPDYVQVVNKNPVLAANQLCPDAGIAVAQSDHTARILYEFGKDTALAIRTAKMSPAQQCIQVGKMIAKIESEGAASTSKNGSRPDAKPGQQKSITKAPPPPTPTKAGGRAQSRDVLDPNMSMDDFARQHRGSKQSARENARRMRGLN
jgi:hypothetical protein